MELILARTDGHSLAHVGRLLLNNLPVAVILGLLWQFHRRLTDTLAQSYAANTALEQAKASLEQRVDERTATLAETLAAQQVQATALAESLAIQQRLNQTITALSVPVIPVRHDVLVVPLVGTIEHTRAQQLLQHVLAEIEQRHAHVILFDVTGIVQVDTTFAQALLNTAAAARLLGTTSMLVGVQPTVAQALGALGADIAALQTAASLEVALARLPGQPPVLHSL